MSDIPQARERLIAFGNRLATDYPAGHFPEVGEILSLMVREAPSYQRAPRKNFPPIDEETAQKIRDIKDANPTMHLQDIAEAFDTNIGRVSEALRRQR